MLKSHRGRRGAFLISFLIHFSLQVNYLSAVYLVTLLLPLLVSGGTTPPSPARVTILGSEAYYNSAIPDDLLSSPSILHRLSERSYCSSR
jgi:hypothetical protein